MTRLPVLEDRLERHARTHRQSPFRFRLVLGACLLAAAVASSFTSGCALFRSDYTVPVDSISVTQTAAPGTFVVRVFGWGNNSCASLKRVERSTSQDTLLRRLVGENERGLCPQSERRLTHSEQVTVLAGRTIWYAVRQPDGSRLLRAISSP